MLSGLSTAASFAWLLTQGDARTLFCSALGGGEDVAVDAGPGGQQGVSVRIQLFVVYL